MLGGVIARAGPGLLRCSKTSETAEKTTRTRLPPPRACPDARLPDLELGESLGGCGGGDGTAEQPLAGLLSSLACALLCAVSSAAALVA